MIWRTHFRWNYDERSPPLDQETPECFRAPWQFTFSQKRPVKPPERMVLKLPQGADGSFTHQISPFFKEKSSRWDSFASWFACPCWSFFGPPNRTYPKFLDSNGNLNDHHIHHSRHPRNAWKEAYRYMAPKLHLNTTVLKYGLRVNSGAFQPCFQSELTQQISRLDLLPFIKCLLSIFRTPCHTWCTSNRD